MYKHFTSATFDNAALLRAKGNNKTPNDIPRSARNFHTFEFFSGEKALMTITHGETYHREYIYTAQVCITMHYAMCEALALPRDCLTELQKGGGCGYDKHNTAAFSILRGWGIEPDPSSPAGCIFGNGPSGSERILKHIANGLEKITSLRDFRVEEK